MPTTNSTTSLKSLRVSTKRAMFILELPLEDALAMAVSQVDGRDLSILILEANEEIHPASTKKGYGHWFPTSLDEMLRDILKGVLSTQLQIEVLKEL